MYVIGFHQGLSAPLRSSLQVACCCSHNWCLFRHLTHTLSFCEVFYQPIGITLSDYIIHKRLPFCNSKTVRILAPVNYAQHRKCITSSTYFLLCIYKRSGVWYNNIVMSDYAIPRDTKNTIAYQTERDIIRLIKWCTNHQKERDQDTEIGETKTLLCIFFIFSKCLFQK